MKKLTDREVLEIFYNSTNGNNWRRNTNWCSKKPLNDWYGITAETHRGVEYVTKINLYYNNLAGTIPVELGNLKKIRLFECFR